ncbi:hypothetical protein PE066_18055 [Ramlibacter tataouinensis]|uniref:hypothetical protein n=1 Tax=Ramlibacter tataouinensis TaxID=94132 RepID=UPI0022F3F295|nr:hypothetical protein [Ramlibacter tataouinensis]WBY01345.1 hypothetical protein PE066_18055 [Ramlibacter tataouinensis]
MSAIRILLAWLLLAALPLQGFAAATTLLCGPAHHGAASAAAAGPADRQPAAVEGDGHRHAHASAAGAHHGAAGTDAAPLASNGTGHSCNLCSAACHGLGIASQPSQVAPTGAPHVPLTEAFQRLASRPAPVPDKPPRA